MADKLVLFPGNGDLPSFSPFCSKALWMGRHAEAKFDVIWTNDPRRSPTKKLPILIREEGDPICGSDAIARYFEVAYGHDFDASLARQDLPASVGLIRLIEEHLYFLLLAARWKDDANFAQIAPGLKASAPWVLKPFLPSMVRKSVIAQVDKQGAGRLDAANFQMRAEEDLHALSERLGENAFLFGDDITRADYSAIAVLATILALGDHTPLKQTLARYENLMSYAAIAQALPKA